jgi:DNA-binding HxlR family transcriptional regulator
MTLAADTASAKGRMAMKSYGQFCPIAKAAELFCERWTALILRDLASGVSRFAQLQRGVPQASPTLLTRRLRQLEAEGIVVRCRSDTGRSWTYHLTLSGQEFLPIVKALGEWGQKWSRRELADHEVNASLLLWAMERGARPDAFGARRGVVKLTFADRRVSKRHYWLVSENGRTELCIEDPGFEVNLYLTTTLRDMIYIWRGDLALARAVDEGRLEVLGEAWARRALPHWLARSKYAAVKPERRSVNAISSHGKSFCLGSESAVATMTADRLLVPRQLTCSDGSSPDGLTAPGAPDGEAAPIALTGAGRAQRSTDGDIRQHVERGL